MCGWFVGGWSESFCRSDFNKKWSLLAVFSFLFLQFCSIITDVRSMIRLTVIWFAYVRTPMIYLWFFFQYRFWAKINVLFYPSRFNLTAKPIKNDLRFSKSHDVFLVWSTAKVNRWFCFSTKTFSSRVLKKSYLRKWKWNKYNEIEANRSPEFSLVHISATHTPQNP